MRSSFCHRWMPSLFICSRVEWRSRLTKDNTNNTISTIRPMLTLNMHQREKMSRINTRIARQHQHEQQLRQQTICVTLNLSFITSVLLWALEMIECLHAPSLLLKKLAHLHSLAVGFRHTIACEMPNTEKEMSERKTRKNGNKKRCVYVLLTFCRKAATSMLKLVLSTQNTRSKCKKKIELKNAYGIKM